MTHIKYLQQCAKRRQRCVDLYKKGKSSTDIAVILGVSRARVQQILAKDGIGRKDGGSFVRSEKRKERKREALDKRYQKIYGCNYSEWADIQQEHKNYRQSPAYSYRNHKNVARIRKIEFKLTLPEWWKIWKESGKFNKRGRQNTQYAMSRLGDEGPYSVDNVKIVTTEENRNEYWESPRASVHGALCQRGRKKKGND